MTADPELEAQIRAESNRALAKGAWYAMFLGIASFIPVGAMALRDPRFVSAAGYPVAVTLSDCGPSPKRRPLYGSLSIPSGPI